MCFDRMQLRLDVENELLPKAAFFLEQPVITVGLQSGDLDGRKHGALLRHEMSHPGARLCTPRSPMVLHPVRRSEEHTSELQSLMRISYAVFCLKKKKQININ